MFSCRLNIYLSSVALLILTTFYSISSHAETRRAFLVGVDQYENFTADRQLDNAVSDANAIARSLSSIGFNEVTAKENLTRFEFNTEWQTFLDSIEPGDTVTFFFSGHGVAIDGENYLLPRSMPDLQAGRTELIKSESLRLNNLLLDIQKRKPAVTVMILDACRNDPFASSALTRESASAGGLAGSNDPPSGTFIMYSAAAGMVALDGIPGDDQPHSVYTSHLLELIPRTDLSIAAMARELRQRVNETTKNAADGFLQSPAYYDGLVGDFCLAGCDDTSITSTPSSEKPLAIAATDEPTHSRNTAEQAAPVISSNEVNVALVEQLDLNKTVGELKDVSKKDRRAAAASRRKGEDLYWKKPNKALAAYRKATDLDPNNQEGWDQYGNLLIRTDDLDGALEAFNRLQQLAAINEDQQWMAIAMDKLGSVYQQLGDFDKTEAYYNRSLELEKDKRRSASTYSRLGALKLVRGDLSQAEALYLKALELFKDTGDEEEIAGQYGRLGMVYRHYGDLDRSESSHLKSLEMQKKLKRPSRVAGQYSNLALLYRDRGNSEESEQHHLKALEIYESLEDRSSLADQYGMLGVLYENRGDYENAEQAFMKSLDLLKELGRAGQIAYQTSNLGDLYKQQNDLDESEKFYRNALEIYQTLNRKDGMAEQYGAIGELYRLRGDRAQARELWKTGQKLYEDLGLKRKANKFAAWMTELE